MRKNLKRLKLTDRLEIQYHDRKYWLAYEGESVFNAWHATYFSPLIYRSVSKKALLWLCYEFLFHNLPNPISKVAFDVSRSHSQTSINIHGTLIEIGRLNKITAMGIPCKCYGCSTRKSANSTVFHIDYKDMVVQVEYQNLYLGVEAMKKLLQFLRVKRYTKKGNSNETISQ